MIKLSNEKLPFDFKIVIYSHFDKLSEKFLGIEVHHLNSNRYDRWDAFKMFPEAWICFLDADCKIDEILISIVLSSIQKHNTSTVICGRYKTDVRSPALSHAYNTLCNTWLESGILASEPRLLGGLFVIYSSSQLQSIQFEKFAKWGAEDYRMARQLGTHQFNFVLSENLHTIHSPQTEFKWFVRRAWLHGKNRPDNVKINLNHWTKILSQQKLSSIFFIFIHFGILLASVNANKIKLGFDTLTSFFYNFIDENFKYKI